MALTQSFNISVAPNTEQPISVRTRTFSSLSIPNTWKRSELTLLRVGRLLIQTDYVGLSKSPNTLQVTYRRTLIALLLYHYSYKKVLFARNTLLRSTLAKIIIFFHYVRFSLLPTDTILRIMSQMRFALQETIPFAFPSTLLVDISLSSKDILGLLLVRFSTFYNDLLSLRQQLVTQMNTQMRTSTK